MLNNFVGSDRLQKYLVLTICSKNISATLISVALQVYKIHSPGKMDKYRKC